MFALSWSGGRMSLLMGRMSTMIMYAKVTRNAFVVNVRLIKRPAQNTAPDFARNAEMI